MTSFREGDHCTVLGSNIRANIFKKTESGRHFVKTERWKQNKLQYAITVTQST